MCFYIIPGYYEGIYFAEGVMEIYAGGRSQGKLEYVLKKKGLGKDVVIDGSNLKALAGSNGKLSIELDSKYLVINHFHELTRSYADMPEVLYGFAEKLVNERPGIIIISDQVGGGIVPLYKADNEWRELHGRIMCRLVENACHFERIICGIGQVIK